MNTEVQESVANLEREVYSLGKENEIQNRVFAKFEETLEKIQVLTETLHRLIVQHEERIKINAEAVEALRVEMRDEIKELEERISRENKNLCEKIEKSEERILAKILELKQEWDKEEKATTEKKATINEQVNQLMLKFASIKWFLLGSLLAGAYLLGHVNIISVILKLFAVA
jgi:oligoendopeptidase F